MAKKTDGFTGRNFVDGLRIKGVSLHSYRYTWAERAKQCGYPERFAQEALGHNSKAVHRAYARQAKVRLPSLALALAKMDPAVLRRTDPSR
jgi:integrase